MKKQNKTYLIINGIVLFMILGLIAFVSIKYGAQIMDKIKSPKVFADWMNSFGAVGALILIGFQMLQIIIAVVPGEVIQIASGTAFGGFFGSVYAIIGLLLGSVVVFFGVRFLGFGFIKALVPEKQLDKYNKLLNDPKFEIILFVIFFIPGLPKDVLVYFAGLTPIKPLRFFLITLIARSPAIIGSAVIGASLGKQNYTVVIIIAAIAIVTFVLGIIFQEKIIHKASNFKK